MAFEINKKNIIILVLTVLIAFLMYDRYQIASKKSAEEIKLRYEKNKSLLKNILKFKKSEYWMIVCF